MTDAINAKSEALELHELSSEELDAVSGGNIAQKAEDKKAGDQIKAFEALLNSL